MSKRYSSADSLSDVAFNLKAFFICMFTLAFLLMSKKVEENSKIESKAEYIITTSWPEDLDLDIDGYLEDPSGNLVFFKTREAGLMHMDRDDRGVFNDVVELQDGTTYTVKENKEITTIRGIIPGEYVFNVHLFRGKETQTCPVTIKLEKINPSLKLIAAKDLVLHGVGDEKTAFRFTLDASGDVTNTSDLPKSLLVTEPTFNVFNQ